jgi:hypothetical protein
MCESGCILPTPLIKSGVLIPHSLFRCAASSSAVYTGEKHFATGTPKPALSLSVPAPSISARERSALIVFVYVPDAINITPRRDRGQARRAPRQTFVRTILFAYPAALASVLFMLAALPTSSFLSAPGASFFSRSLHDTQEGRTQLHYFAAIARSSARTHDLISGQLTRAHRVCRVRFGSFAFLYSKASRSVCSGTARSGDITSIWRESAASRSGHIHHMRRLVAFPKLAQHLILP